jgi:hypothetical protein
MWHGCRLHAGLRLWTGVLLSAVAVGAVIPSQAPASSRHGLGLVEPARAPSKAPSVIRFAAATPPASADLTSYAPPVGNQEQVNSCAAWATDYTALGYWENRLGIAGGVLAPMYTYSQVTSGQNVGTSIEEHLDIAKSQGVDSSADYWQGATDYWDQPTASETTNAANWKVSGYQELALGQSASSTVTQQSIEAAVAADEPVVIGFPVYDNFMYLSPANHGFYSGIGGSYDGGHAVTVLGYDSTGVRIENSWGTSWGDSGFATLSWAFVNQYVLDAVAVGQLTGSAPATTAPVNTGAPVISGSGVDGGTLTTSLGTWSPSGSSKAIRWQRSTDGVNWSDTGATGLSYSTQAADLGADLHVIVTETNSFGQASATSAPFGPIASGPPQIASSPVITGVPQVGTTISASPGTWMPAAPNYAYTWQYSADGQSGWVTIAGAHGASYTIGAGDAGTYLRVRVVATNAVGASTAISSPFGPVTVPVPVNTVRPTIAGTARVGLTLRASAGRWSMAGTVEYAWQYSADGRAGWVTLPGARGTSFTIGAAYTGTYLRARVRMGTVDAYSASVGPIGSAVHRSPALRVGRARVSARTVSFTVMVASGTGRPQATAVAPGHRVRLRAHGGGSRFTFTGRLSRARWVVTVTLHPVHASFVVVVNR